MAQRWVPSQATAWAASSHNSCQPCLLEVKAAACLNLTPHPGGAVLASGDGWARRAGNPPTRQLQGLWKHEAGGPHQVRAWSGWSGVLVLHRATSLLRIPPVLSPSLAIVHAPTAIPWMLCHCLVAGPAPSPGACLRPSLAAVPSRPSHAWSGQRVRASCWRARRWSGTVGSSSRRVQREGEGRWWGARGRKRVCVCCLLYEPFAWRLDLGIKDAYLRNKAPTCSVTEKKRLGYALQQHNCRHSSWEEAE